MFLPSSAQQRCAIIGAGFGLIFPVLALIIRVVQFGWSQTLGLILSDPLLWIIGTAPIFLGGIAWAAGKQHELVLEQIDAAEQARQAAEDAQERSNEAFRQLRASRARLAQITATEEALHQLETVVEGFRRIIEQIGHFDLSVSLIHSQELYGEHGEAVSHTLEETLNNLRGTLTEVVNAVSATHQASARIQSSTVSIGRGMSEQTSQVGMIIKETSRMAESLAENGEQAARVADLAEVMSTKVENGGALIGSTIDEMVQISQSVLASMERVDAVGKRSRDIEEVIRIVEDVAERTNLLALNAAIEAARAGVHGRGFAVVAEEVRKLAGQTQKATHQIAASIDLIQREIHESIGSLKTGMLEMQGTSGKASKAVLMLEEVVRETSQLARIVTELVSANQEHQAMGTKIQQTANGIGVVTGATATVADEIAAIAQDLNTRMAALDQLVRTFTLENPATYAKKTDPRWEPMRLGAKQPGSPSAM